MGMFGGDGDNGMSDRLGQQQQEADRKTELARQNLARQRMQIIQGQGGQIWKADISGQAVKPIIDSGQDGAPPGAV